MCKINIHLKKKKVSKVVTLFLKLFHTKFFLTTCIGIFSVYSVLIMTDCRFCEAVFINFKYTNDNMNGDALKVFTF